jgi:hypothetical protein
MLFCPYKACSWGASHLCCVEISKYSLSFEVKIHGFCQVMLYCWVNSSWTMKVEALQFFRVSVGNCYCALLHDIQKTWIPRNSTVTVSNVASFELLHFSFSKDNVWVRVILRISPGGYAFNNEFCILCTQCIYVFCVDLRTNSDYFPMQH